MKYLAAYALLHLSGKKDITAKDIKSVLSSVSATQSDADINRLIETLKGKDINKLIAEGLTKIGGAASGPAKPAAKVDNKKQAPKEAPKKKQEPKKEAPKEQEDDDMGLGGGLFD